MTKIKFLYFLIAFMIYSQDAMASPGGIVFKAIEKSFWAQIVLLFLFIIFSPLILYITYAERLKIRKTYSDLRKIAKIDDNFDWMHLKVRINDSFLRVHSAWKKEDMKLASEWMTTWYWQNQQLVYLDQWEEEGLINICRVKEINTIKPVYVEFKTAGNGSRVVVAINALIEDYLLKRNTQEIIEGEKGFNYRETLWTFILKDNKWLLENIEASLTLSEYVKLRNVVSEKEAVAKKS
ncbi:MAG: TIM44-like domain-containing protein [Cyanobacteriota bacterium]